MQFQIEIDDEKNELTGDIPEQLDTILKRIEGEALTRGRGEGIEKAAQDAKAQIEGAVRAKQAELEAAAPYERARLKQLEDANDSLSSKLSEATQGSDRSIKALKEAHAQDIMERARKLESRDSRIRQLTRKALRADAMQAGAREESLEELELLLESQIGYTDDMEPFVKGPDGNPLVSQGNPVTIGAFVKDYLDSHNWHKRAVAPYRGGQARHGMSLTGGVEMSTTDREATITRVQEGDRSAGAIDALFKATRKKPA